MSADGFSLSAGIDTDGDAIVPEGLVTLSGSEGRVAKGGGEVRCNDKGIGLEVRGARVGGDLSPDGNEETGLTASGGGAEG